MKLNDPEGHIRYGTYELNLYKPPINLRKTILRDQIPDKNIKITIQMPEEKDLDELQQELEDMEDDQREQEKIEEAKKIKEIPYIECKRNYLNVNQFYEKG